MRKYLKEIERLKAEMPALSDGLFELEEYILLPHYGGNIILRFRLNRESVTPDELDGLEKRLYSLVPEGFLADFMGDVYRRAGVSFEGLLEKQAECVRAYADEPITVSPYRGEVLAEAGELLALCGLPADSEVWEIQPDEDETALFLLGDENARVKTFTAEGRRYTVLKVERAPCEGLMRAAMYAKRKGICLLRAVAER